MPNKTSSKPALRLLDTTLLFVDPGINCTGLAVIEIDSKGARTPVKWCKAKPDPELSTVKRLQWIWEMAVTLQKTYLVDQLVVEEPPETVYGQSGRSANYAIGRATSIFKTFAVAHAVIAASISARPMTKAFTVLPSHWQPSKKRRDGLDTKTWSLNLANKIIETDKINMNGSPRVLRTEDDENIADALCMGWILTLPQS